MNFIILKNFHENKDAVVFNNHVLIAHTFWNMQSKKATTDSLFHLGLSKEKWQEVLDAVQKGVSDSNSSAELPRFALEYCSKVEIDPDMRQIILNSGDPQWAYRYSKFVAYDNDMRQTILNSQNPQWACYWCELIENDSDMRQVIINSKDSEYAWRYCVSVSDDADMRQIIIDNKDQRWADVYCITVGNDADMKKVVSYDYQ